MGRLVAILMACAAAACGSGPEPVLRATALAPTGVGPEVEGAVVVDATGTAYEAEIELPAEAWNFAEAFGVHTAWARMQPADGDLDRGLQLIVDGRSLERVKVNGVDVFSTEVLAGQFAYHAGALIVRTADGQPPREAVLLQRGELETAPGGAATVKLGGVTAEGLLVAPGQAVEYDLPASRAGVLSLLVGLHGFDAQGIAVEGEFEVSLDGEPLATLELAGGRGATVRCWSVPLPDGGADRQLRVELRAPLALGCVAVPRLEFPDTVAADERPDVVVFSADTFRADNLAAYAERLGTLDARPEGLMPYLDGLAGDSALFLDTWSSSSWTLPAHATMLTGLWPPQHTAADARRALPESAETLAEVLSAAGWRTVAVTGGGYCSAGRGLDQGFEVFYESELGFGDIAEKALELAAFDDGRPLFLFVHTFRVHSPYLARQETLERLDLDVEPRIGFAEIASEVFTEAMAEPERIDEIFEESRPLLPRMRALYLGGVAEFDDEFRAFHEGLLELGRLDDRGILAFTSDHGEQFGENRRFGHSTELWEAVLRVPLFLRGPGIEPGARETPASLVDLMPTLLGLLGLELPGDLAGRDLFGADAAPELFAFHPGNPLSQPATARILGAAKRLEIDGEPQALDFDLAVDPLGLDPRPAGDSAWPAGEAGFSSASAARFETADANLDDFTRERLRQLGYLDADPVDEE